MARRTVKRRKFFRRRNNVRSSRGRRTRRVFRRFKRNFKKNTRTLRLNKGQLSARQSLIKLSTTKNFTATNIGVGNYVWDIPIPVNSLDESAVWSSGDAYQPYPVWQMAQWYQHYMVYKAKVEIWVSPTGSAFEMDLTDTTARCKLFALSLKPDTSGTVLDFTTWNWSNTTSGQTPEDSVNTKTKHFNGYGTLLNKGYVYMKHWCNPVRLYDYHFGGGSKTSEQFYGTITPSGSVVTPSFSATAPAFEAYMHMVLADTSENASPSTMDCRILYKVTKYVRFVDQRRFSTNVAEI